MRPTGSKIRPSSRRSFLSSLLVLVLALCRSDALAQSPGSFVSDVRFDPAAVRPGESFTATFIGSNLTDSTYIDVRYRMPGSNENHVALNWQRGATASHVVPSDTVVGPWVVTGLRAHQNAGDTEGFFWSTLVAPVLFVIPEVPGPFFPTGHMTAPRTGHTATLLPNGKVLITGGINLVYRGGETVWASAELYDSTTGTFSATGSMTTPRWLHSATLLPNGTVLITGGTAGGYRNFRGLTSAEIYDPSTGRFAPTSSMTTARADHSATLLADGKVLIAGGLEENFGSFKISAELYVPSTDAFTDTGDMTTERFSHTATLLADGRVLLDGTGGDGPLVDHADLYDSKANKFSPTGTTSPAIYPIAADAATLLMNGTVLAIRTDDRGSSGLLFDPSSGTYASIGFVGVRYRNQQTATLLPDRTVLIAGGDYLGEALLYDPATATFSSAGNMAIYRRDHTATLLPDGTVLIAGGYETPPVSLDSAQLYRPDLLTPAPVILSVTGASADNPAGAGDTLKIFCIGLVDGSVIPPQVTIGGRMAEILDFGKAPGFEGLNQVNFRVPAGVAPGPAVPVRLTYLARPSNEVTLGVR